MTDYLQVVTTIASREDAERIAREVIDERLAACAQIGGPVTSVYSWKGAVQTAAEWQCLFKTRRELYPRLEQRIRDLHPYEVPEILATAVVAGSPDYFEWIDKSVG